MVKTQTQIVINSDLNENTFYNSYYQQVTDKGIAWRDFGAIEKAESIIKLSYKYEIKTVVEIGCGLGNVLSRLDKLNFAQEYCGVEISQSAIDYIKNNVYIPRLKAVYLEDTTNMHFANDSFDLGVLSHVLEHVPNPDVLLKEALRICKYVIIEVPLEDCLISNLYAQFRSLLTGKKRIENPTGHIHFFNKRTISEIVLSNGARIMDDRQYRLNVFDNSVKENFLNLMYDLFGSYMVSAHYAMILKKSGKIDS